MCWLGVEGDDDGLDDDEGGENEKGEGRMSAGREAFRYAFCLSAGLWLSLCVCVM